MVRLLLSIKAELENVTDLVPASDDFEFFFKVKCTSCNEEHPKLVTVNRLEEREVTSGKGSTANFVWRCGLCKRESSAKFEPGEKPKPYTADSNGQFAPFLTIDCRGLEFTGFDPKGIWKCVGTESGTPFTDVDLEEGEWVDYDEKSALPVGVSHIECKWARA
ncbi:DUF866-domain-containing protein [Polyporus arcularius HHB13444]|uniref:DUF866-domain-containing protein n=2 Tax=Polyporaceae TaxID=5317 RepID=A0A5C3Q2W2_9APHY|nr:DUF866-domain-containing protein [Polyporus brumalis]TFK92773.1 DUF866-domain-containing protein [Polyporus arcularius HHB13444]